jgi:serine/threonine protein phosphatase PrpC
MHKKDRILVCSDGVTDLLEGSEITDHLARSDIEDAARYLEIICDQRSDDNWTFVLAEKA